MGEQSVDRVKRVGTAAVLIGAPLVTALGFLLHPRIVADPASQLGIVADDQGRWAAAHLLMLVGAVCFIPAAIGVMPRLGGRAARAGLIGAELATIGAVFVGVVMGVDAFAAVAPAWQAIQDERGIVPLANLVALLSLGFVVLGVALFVARRAPRWASAAIALGELLQGFLNVPDLLIVGVVGCLLMAAGFAPIAQECLRPARTVPARAQGAAAGVTAA